MRPTPYVASLRVYEPIDSFDLVDQQRWSQITHSATSSWDEQRRALIRVIKSQPSNAKSDGIHQLMYQGKRYIAPWSTTTRCWAALSNIKLTLPNNC